MVRQITIHLTDEQYEKVLRYAEENGITRHKAVKVCVDAIMNMPIEEKHATLTMVEKEQHEDDAFERKEGEKEQEGERAEKGEEDLEAWFDALFEGGSKDTKKK